MSLLYIDGFEKQDHFYRGWSRFNANYTVSSQAGRFGGYALRADFATAMGVTRPVPQATTLHIGFAYRIDNIGPSFTLPCLALFGDAGTVQHLYIGPNGATGKWQVKRGDWTGTLLAESTGTVSLGAFLYVEVMASIADSGGRVVVKVDGATVIDYTGDTKNGGANAYADRLMLGSQAAFGSPSNPYIWYDDLYVCDTTGSSLNGFLGDCRVQSLSPSGAGSSTQFTPTGSANNWDNVNDVPPVTSTYNASATVGHRDTYALEDLSTVGTVLAAQSVILAQKSDTGAGTFKAALKSGANVYYGSTKTPTDILAGQFDVFATNPATSSAWTQSSLNALELGAEVV